MICEQLHRSSRRCKDIVYPPHPLSDFAMLLVLQVAFREVHNQLAQPGRLETTVDMLHEYMVGLGYESPKIALAGLNPHCGDGDIYGVTEETTIIEPCREKLQTKGYNVHGPIPGDTCFMRAVKGEFDAVVAMYHDEGHIPAKLMGFGDTVNVTLGTYELVL